jgi:hypothetical protein
MPTAEPDVLDVLLPVTSRAAPLNRVRRRLSKQPLRRMWRGRLPVPQPQVALVQCAAELPRSQVLELVEFAIRNRLTTLARLREVCGRGVRGSVLLQDVVAELSTDGVDRWVRRLLRLLDDVGVPRPELEVPVAEDGRVRAYLDGLWRGLRLALEVDDWESHGARDAQERDRRRDRWLLRDYGITTLRLTPREIRDSPEAVVADIAAACERCGGVLERTGASAHRRRASTAHLIAADGSPEALQRVAESAFSGIFSSRRVARSSAAGRPSVVR